MNAVLLALVLTADRAPVSEHVQQFLDAREAFRADQSLRVKQSIADCENELEILAFKGVTDQKKIRATQMQIADLKKALAKLEDKTQDLRPDLRRLKVGMIGELPTQFSEFIGGRWVEYKCNYEIDKSTPAGQWALVRATSVTSDRKAGDGRGGVFRIKFPNDMIKGQKVDKLLAEKVWRVTEETNEFDCTLEPFDMAEVETFLKK